MLKAPAAGKVNSRSPDPLDYLGNKGAHLLSLMSAWHWHVILWQHGSCTLTACRVQVHNLAACELHLDRLRCTSPYSGSM